MQVSLFITKEWRKAITKRPIEESFVETQNGIFKNCNNKLKDFPN